MAPPGEGNVAFRQRNGLRIFALTAEFFDLSLKGFKFGRRLRFLFLPRRLR